MAIDPRTPVIVGAAQVTDRGGYPGQKLEPLLAAGDAPFRVGRCRGLAIILPVYNGVHVAPEGRRLPVDG